MFCACVRVLQVWGGMRLSPVVMSATSCRILPVLDDDDDDGDECGSVGGMVGSGNQSTQRKPTSVLLYPPKIPHDLTYA